MEGGVREPLVGAVPLLPSLEASVDPFVAKLALDLLRSSLKLLMNEGAIAQRRAVIYCQVRPGFGRRRPLLSGRSNPTRFKVQDLTEFEVR